MKNHFEINGAITTIYLYDKGKHIKCYISTEDLPLIQSIPGTWSYMRTRCGYAFTRIKDKTILMHRLIMDFPEGLIVDHRDQDGLNNERKNLRTVTNSQNLHNQKKTKGYTYCKRTGKWQAQIRVNGKQLFLGRFDTEEEAKSAADKRREEVFKT